MQDFPEETSNFLALATTAMVAQVQGIEDMYQICTAKEKRLRAEGRSRGM